MLVNRQFETTDNNTMLLRRQPLFSEDELLHHIRSGQNDRSAFLPTKTTTRTLAETLTAMANADGGLIVLGMTASGAPQKGNESKALQELFSAATLLSDPPLILPSPQLLNLAGTVVLIIELPPGLPHVYSLQGLYLTRTAGQNRPLTTPELRRLLLDRSERGFESHPVEEATLEMLDPARIERYLERIQAPPDSDLLRLLYARGCLIIDPQATRAAGIGNGRAAATPTVAGLLLFGRQPQQHLRSAEIICVRYAGTSMGDEFVRQDIAGTLPDQIRQAETFVTANMRRGMRITGMARQETTEYPLAVVREAIVNAVAHRDYSIRGEGVRLLMFSNRLEVYSPGRLPGHVTLDNLKDERYSRNEAIVAILSDLGYIERLGYGIDRMIAAMLDAGLPEPKFEETAAGFRVTLHSAGNDLVSAQPQEQRWRHSLLNERQERAMAFVQQQGRIANSDLLEMYPSVSDETIRRDLADLVEKNLLIRIGAKKATYYILK